MHKQNLRVYRLVIRIRCDAVAAKCPLGIKFGCDPVTEAPRLLKLAAVLGLDVSTTHLCILPPRRTRQQPVVLVMDFVFGLKLYALKSVETFSFTVLLSSYYKLR